MILSTSPIAIAILLSWLLHFPIARLVKSQNQSIKSYYQGLWKILGYIGLVSVGIEISQITMVIFSGILPETFAFLNRLYGSWFWWMFDLDVLAPILFCLNLIPSLRNSTGFRNFQLGVIAAIIGTRLAFFGNYFTISIIPGWHTTIDFITFPLTMFIAGALILWLNWRNLKIQKAV